MYICTYVRIRMYICTYVQGLKSSVAKVTTFTCSKGGLMDECIKQVYSTYAHTYVRICMCGYVSMYLHMFLLTVISNVSVLLVLVYT